MPTVQDWGSVEAGVLMDASSYCMLRFQRNIGARLGAFYLHFFSTDMTVNHFQNKILCYCFSSDVCVLWLRSDHERMEQIKTVIRVKLQDPINLFPLTLIWNLSIIIICKFWYGCRRTICYHQRGRRSQAAGEGWVQRRLGDSICKYGLKECGGMGWQCIFSTLLRGSNRKSKIVKQMISISFRYDIDVFDTQ